jgi:phosphoserine phosphatase RsbU/P
MSEPRLRVRDEQGRRVVPINKSPYTVGRRSACDLKVVSVDVSRDHAEIVTTGTQYVLRDRGSQHGTFVNGVVITERPLVHGDRIRLGRGDVVELVFLADGRDSGTDESSSLLPDLRQIATLFDSLRALGSGKALDEVLTLVMDAAIDVCDADRGFIMLANASGELEFKIGRGRGGITVSGKVYSTSAKIPRDVYLTGRTFDDRIEGELANIHTDTIMLGIRHVLCAALPIVHYGDRARSAAARETRIGVLYLDAKDRNVSRSNMRRAALETFATEAALAIESARLYAEAAEKARIDHELQIAAEMQRRLLPEPQYRGKWVAAAGDSMACRAVGGDFFDYVTLADGSFGFALGDVAGKGPPAALLTAKLQGIFTSYTASCQSPAQTMAHVNHVLIGRPIEARFATMFYGVISAEGLLTYCNAGHNPPLLLTRQGIRRLETGGLVLGLFPQPIYEEASCDLEPGDILVVFSDGVTEALNPSGTEFGEERILAVLEQRASDDPPLLLARLLAAVSDFATGAVQNDDITAMVVRYTGHELDPQN